ncbi:Aste57867_12619 [Aphanomyces stellatus]|uniref:Aste57867_12619 protein n=1 Tax=Aphanomyces stellatus TaxID=120398 RepID=A0A485KWE7_9STRA|nr:hypothetical protein As57867_012573 [Aphanomyces stellatus]VFT89469.1 Aste57867_12619 [Aphanomyces stellatus]
MALNFWQSTHYLHWMKNLRIEDFKHINPKDTKLTLAEVESIHLSMISLIEELGARLHINQIIICTAIIMYKRFYLTQSFCEFDPRLVSGTALFISSKIEECQVRLTDIATHLHELTTKIPEDKDSMYDFTEKDIIECEFYLIEATQYDMIIHHPFSTLIKLYEEFEETFPMNEHSFKTAWDLCLFTFRTPIILLRPPFLIAHAVVYLTMQDASYDTSEFLDRVNIKSDSILQVVAELQNAFSDFKAHSTLQQSAMAKLEDIVPDPFATY